MKTQGKDTYYTYEGTVEILATVKSAGRHEPVGCYGEIPDLQCQRFLSKAGKCVAASEVTHSKETAMNAHRNLSLTLDLKLPADCCRRIDGGGVYDIWGRFRRRPLPDVTKNLPDVKLTAMAGKIDKNRLQVVNHQDESRCGLALLMPTPSKTNFSNLRPNPPSKSRSRQETRGRDRRLAPRANW